MFAVMSIHRPHLEKATLVIESMHRYGDAARSQKGLVSVHTLKDERSGDLIGLAIWDSEESYLAARPVLMKATEGDDFDSWEREQMQGFKLHPV